MVTTDKKEFYSIAQKLFETNNDGGIIQICEPDFEEFDRQSSGGRAAVSFCESDIDGIKNTLMRESKLLNKDSKYNMIAQVVSHSMTMAELCGLKEILTQICAGCLHFKMGFESKEKDDNQDRINLTLFLFFCAK